MNVIRYNPASGIFNLRREMNSLMDNFFDSPSRQNHHGFPVVDIYEKGDNLFVEAAIPGIKKEDISLEIKEGILYISGEYKSKDINEENYHIKEHSIGKFSRSFHLPSYVDSNKVKASCVDGVLILEIGKLEEVKPKKILIG